MKRKYAAENSNPAALIALTLVLALLIIVPIYNHPWHINSSSSVPPQSSQTQTQTQSSSDGRPAVVVKKSIRLLPEECDVFRGEWVPNPKAPYYTNETCWAIHEHQNCMKYGRPDTDFMKWRWKPDGCELPVFNPAVFLDLVRGKSMAFVGDSVGRNQMQSLMCLLSRVTYPTDASKTQDEKFRRWLYPLYNFTIANYWSPFLVKSIEAYPNNPSLSGQFNLYLDEPDYRWISEIEEFDYVIISAGQWFYRPNFYFENNKPIGCHYCFKENITDMSVYYGYRHAFRTTFAQLNSLSNYKGITFLRTYAPSHFENGEWDKGGNCVRTRPFRSNETRLEGLNFEMYMTQLEEFRKAAEEGEEKGLKYQLLDITDAMLLRPDGHPSRYGHPKGAKLTLYNDCVHWCLPGPIDTWNDFLLEMLKRERMRVIAKGRVESGRS